MRNCVKKVSLLKLYTLSVIGVTRKAPKRTSDSQKPFQTNRKWKYSGTLILNSQPSTSYLIPIQIAALFATVFKLETTSGFGGTGSTDIGRRRTSKTVLEPSTSDYRTITVNFGQNTIYHKTGSGNTAKTPYFNSQPSTSYSTSIQCVGLLAIVSTLETTSVTAKPKVKKSDNG